jgi:L-ribulokinase
MGQGFDAEYFPNQENVGIYQKRYEKYQQLGQFLEQQISIGENKAEAKETISIA